MGALARCLLPLLGLAALTAQAAPIPVTLERKGDQWVLLRGGEPYEIHGAGVDGTDFEALAARGGIPSGPGQRTFPGVARRPYSMRRIASA